MLLLQHRLVVRRLVELAIVGLVKFQACLRQRGLITQQQLLLKVIQVLLQLLLLLLHRNVVVDILPGPLVLHDLHLRRVACLLVGRSGLFRRRQMRRERLLVMAGLQLGRVALK